MIVDPNSCSILCCPGGPGYGGSFTRPYYSPFYNFGACTACTYNGAPAFCSGGAFNNGGTYLNYAGSACFAVLAVNSCFV
ncbi:unnamed protein product [Adineta steineri]|uniref:Uncharacterized protein n=1 Tax=Adineta steineri TaxID=433720 RepID=A0A814NUQ3_9BILA|nr:unnamed protein product [Adineta steineri]CAF3955720.1 unnamed protein product [Adineta steineri]